MPQIEQNDTEVPSQDNNLPNNQQTILQSDTEKLTETANILQNDTENVP